MAPVPTPPANTPDLSEEEAARTPNGYPTYYDKIAKEEQELRDAIEGSAKSDNAPYEGEALDAIAGEVNEGTTADGYATISLDSGDTALEPTDKAVQNEDGVEVDHPAFDQVSKGENPDLDYEERDKAEQETYTDEGSDEDEGNNTFDLSK